MESGIGSVNRDDLRQDACEPGLSPAAPMEADGELRRLFDLSVQMLCIAGADGYFKRINPAFSRTLGYSDMELLARPFLDFVHDDDHARTREELQRLAAGRPTAHFENRCRCRDGSYRWFSWSAAPDPRCQLLYAAAVDITDRKQAEDLFRRLLESAPDAMLVASGEGLILLVNELAERLFGYDRSELLGRHINLVIPTRFHQRHDVHLQNFQAAPRVRPMSVGQELFGLRKDGREFPAEISLGPLQTEQGPLIVAAIRDISERKRVEQLLQERNTQLLAAQQIQQYLLPQSAPALPGFEIFGASYPAEFAAGDYFDFLTMPDGSLGVVVADVAGHGIGPALLMASTHAYLNALVETYGDIDEILAHANRALCKETDSDCFVTLLLARLDPAAHTLSYASAGHPTGYLLDGAGKLKATLPSTSCPLGILPEADFPCGDSLSLAPGDLVLLFTDGVVETCCPEGRPFGAERALEFVASRRDSAAKEIVAGLFQAVREFAGAEKPPDDVTLVVIKAIPTW